MSLATILPWIQIVVSIVLVVLILVQKNEGGLGSAFGGGDTGGAYHTKRGAEKYIFNLTIAFAILFGVLAIASLLIN
jgi:preprotein translocase subunit SecG